MSTHDLFARLSAALGEAGIPYMFTGSFASSFHGTPRASNDFDLVMAPTPDLAKLEWSKKSSSERQIEDVAGMLRIRANELDRTYIRAFVSQTSARRPREFRIQD
jgi:hypothetical protein